tara:strand:- start:156 stop:1205 length:1050 start_codon:yes stop_codon:yes gene_type:complete
MIRDNKSIISFTICFFLLAITHIGTLIFFITILVIFLGLEHKRITLKRLLMLAMSFMITALLLEAWPFFDYYLSMSYILNTVTEYAVMLILERTLLVILAAITAALGLYIAVKKKRAKDILWIAIIALLIYNLNIIRLIDLFGFALIGILGLLVLIEEKKWFLPLWWCFGLMQFSLGFFDPIRIMLICALPLHAGAGLVIHRLTEKSQKLWIWTALLALLFLGNIYTTLRWGWKTDLLFLIIPVTMIAATILLTQLRNTTIARHILIACMLVLIAGPLFAKVRYISNYPAAEPIEEIIVKKILKHLGIWEMKREPRPKTSAPPFIPEIDPIPSVDGYLTDPDCPAGACF